MLAISRRAFAALSVVLLTAAPVLADSLAKVSPGEGGFSRAGLDRITAYIKNEIDTGKLPGAMMVIQRHGKTVYSETLGLRDVTTKQPMTADTIFRIYSMSKPITTVAAMILVEEGKLLLDEPVSKYIPAFKNTKVGVEQKGPDGAVTLDLVPQARQMTVQDLMRHTSGITYGFFGEGAVKKLYASVPIVGDFDNAEFADKIAALPLVYQPGTTWDYSYSTDILGRVVEVVSGKSLYQFMKERIFDPLGMTDTAFYVADPKKQSLVAEPLPSDRTIGVGAEVSDPRIARKWESGGGGLVSTMGDYLRFATMIGNGGEFGGKRILSPKTIAYMGSNHIGAGSGIGPGPYYLPGRGFGFGLGFAVRTDAGVSTVEGSVGEMNWSGAGGTSFWVDPKEEMTVVFMAQVVSQRGRIRTTLKNLVYGAMEK